MMVNPEMNSFDSANGPSVQVRLPVAFFRRAPSELGPRLSAARKTPASFMDAMSAFSTAAREPHALRTAAETGAVVEHPLLARLADQLPHVLDDRRIRGQALLEVRRHLVHHHEKHR